MNRKGQAAMEFLMTYGWAILVVIAAIAALAYFGVLSPEKMLPERTTFQAPVPNVDNAIVMAGGADAGYVEIAFKNNVGFTINVTDVYAADGDCGSVSATGAEEISVEGAAFTTIPIASTVTNGQGFRIKFRCTPALLAGEKFKSDITFKYVNTETMQERPHQGTVQGRIV
ncbi:MAG: hypothetical protein KKF44_07895 [Nanoarchaeota archaeon]|nr:hypothetical protein [Nanoarchaeota archaeon]